MTTMHNNRLLLGGRQDGYGMVARLTLNGDIDTTYNSPDGFSLTSVPVGDINDLALYPNGRAVIAGYDNTSDFLAARFLP